VPQSTGPISAASGPKYTILWGDVEEILLLKKFFPIVGTCLSCEYTAQQSCEMVRRWRIFGEFLGPAFSASPVQHIRQFGQLPVWKRTTGQKYNVHICYAGRP